MSGYLPWLTGNAVGGAAKRLCISVLYVSKVLRDDGQVKRPPRLPGAAMCL